MANFQTYEKKEDISSFDLPPNRDIKLRQYGGDRNGNQLEVALDPKSPTGVDLKVLTEKLDAASTAFTVRGTRIGASVEVAAYIAGSVPKANYSTNLEVNVRGEPNKNAGYDIDLISDLAMKGNSSQILLYSRIINGLDPPGLAQDVTLPVLNCGDVAADYGKMLGKPVSLHSFQYYLPAKNDKQADLRFNGAQMTGWAAKIKKLLGDNNLVRVWVIHGDGFTFPTIQDRRRDTHYITIVGHAGNKFMYMDPLPSASKMTYDGGMFLRKTVPHLGELEFDGGSPELGIRSVRSAAADPTSRLSPQMIERLTSTLNYTVIAGPP